MSRESWLFLFGAVSAIGALFKIADSFGINFQNIRHWNWNIPLHQNRQWLLLVFVAVSLVLSGVGFYLSLKPKPPVTVEKNVEKPVTIPCPKPETESHAHKGPASGENQKPAKVPGIVIPPGTIITATTKAPNSAAVGVNTGTVNVNPPVNPNKSTITYNCVGHRVSVGPSASALFQIQDLDSQQTIQAFKDMINLNNAAFSDSSTSHLATKYNEVLKKCEQQKESDPDWLSPRLFCSLAYLALGNREKAKDEFAAYEEKAGSGYATSPCKEIEDFLKTHVQ